MTLTGAGAHGGGRHQVLIIERIVQEVEARADLIWALFQKAAEAFGVSNYPALADEVKGFLQKCLIDQQTALAQTLCKLPPFKGIHSSGPNDGIDTATPPDAARVRKQAWLNAEIDMWVARLDRSSPLVSSDSALIKGDRNIVISGNANSQIKLVVGPEARDAVETALTAVNKVMERNDLPHDFDREGVEALTRDATAEIKKDEPSTFRIAAYLAGLGLALQVLADFKPAYDLVKAAALYFGVTLPAL